MPINFSKLTILVVEDNAAMRDLIVSVLENLGIGSICTASNGNDGFKAFKAHEPDIVITDWEMEPGNGLQLTHNIRRNPMSPNRMVPIIMLTGYSAPRRVIAARDAGVTEFLAKPFTADGLISRIAHVINRPRDYVDYHKFFGPDRRRRADSSFDGPRKRKDDKDYIEYTSTGETRP